MELRHLRYFLAVAEEQNVTRAAMRLHISQPPLSRQIRDLEREIGVTLFDRSGRTVRLTDAGKFFLVEARAVLQRADDAVTITKSVADGKRGQVRIGYAASPTVEILPRALRAFRRTNPDVSVELREMSTQTMLRAVRDGSIDVALIMCVSPEDFAGLTVEELGRFPANIAFHKKHRFARLREVPLEEIAKEPMVTFTRRDYPEVHVWISRTLAPFPRPFGVVEEYPNATGLIAAVEAARGVAFVARSLGVLAGQRLALRPLKPAMQTPPLVITYRKDGISPAAAAFATAARTAKLR